VQGAGDALAEQPLQGRGAGFGAEAAGEGAGGYAGVLGEAGQVEAFMYAVEGPGAGRRQRCLVGVGVDDGPFDELGLTAVAVGRNDGPAGDGGGRGGAVVSTHDMQAQVESGGDSGAGQDVTVVDVEHVRADRHPRKALGELGGAVPVGGGRAAVE